MKIIVTTFYYLNFKLLAQKTVPNHRAYCEERGYTYNPYMFNDEGMAEGYDGICRAGKANALLAHRTLSVQTKADYLFTIGVDAIFTNMKNTIESLIEKYKNYEITVGTDWDGINTSQMLIKKSKTSRKYLLEILAYIAKGGEHDQRYFKENPRPFIAKAQQKEMNSYDHELRLEEFDNAKHWQDGDFILHMAGSSLENRMAVIDKWLGRVK